MKPTYTFIVRTLHTGTGNCFIVPIEIQAETALQAAQERFALQSSGSQEDTISLLVCRHDLGYDDEPQIFRVVRKNEVVA